MRGDTAASPPLAVVSTVRLEMRCTSGDGVAALAGLGVRRGEDLARNLAPELEVEVVVLRVVAAAARHVEQLDLLHRALAEHLDFGPRVDADEVGRRGDLEVEVVAEVLLPRALGVVEERHGPDVAVLGVRAAPRDGHGPGRHARQARQGLDDVLGGRVVLDHRRAGVHAVDAREAHVEAAAQRVARAHLGGLDPGVAAQAQERALVDGRQERLVAALVVVDEGHPPAEAAEGLRVAPHDGHVRDRVQELERVLDLARGRVRGDERRRVAAEGQAEGAADGVALRLRRHRHRRAERQPRRVEDLELRQVGERLVELDLPLEAGAAVDGDVLALHLGDHAEAHVLQRLDHGEDGRPAAARRGRRGDGARVLERAARRPRVQGQREGARQRRAGRRRRRHPLLLAVRPRERPHELDLVHVLAEGADRLELVRAQVRARRHGLDLGHAGVRVPFDLVALDLCGKQPVFRAHPIILHEVISRRWRGRAGSVER